MINKRPRRRSFRRLGRTVCILNAGSPMCMKSVICMLLLLCTSLFTYIDAEAQATNQVTGVVTDANTNATLPNRSEERRVGKESAEAERLWRRQRREVE